MSTGNNIGNIFYETYDEKQCISIVIKDLPAVFTKDFEGEIQKKIDMMESNVEIVTNLLTKKVSESQKDIINATNEFIFLQKLLCETSNIISSMKNNIKTIESNTLGHILNVYKEIRNINRSYRMLYGIHFINTIEILIEELLSNNLIKVSLIFKKITEIFLLDNENYSDKIYEDIEFVNVPEMHVECAYHVQNLKIRELKNILYIQKIIDYLKSFEGSFMNKLENELINIGNNFEEVKYAEIVISYCLISKEPIIADILVNLFIDRANDRAAQYNDAVSGDIQTFFNFLEANGEHIKSFMLFIEFHEKYTGISPLLELIRPVYNIDESINCEMYDAIVVKVGVSIKQNLKIFRQKIETNIVECLSKINISSLDSLSYIKLLDELKSFGRIIQSEKVREKIDSLNIDFLKKYTVGAVGAIKTSIENDNWVPKSLETSYMDHILMTPDSNKEIFSFESDYTCNSVSASSQTAIRIIHALVCLSTELDPIKCNALVMKVVSAYIIYTITVFSLPIPLFTNGSRKIHLKIASTFSRDFANGIENLAQFLDGYYTSDSKRIENSGIQMMQMVCATDSIDLLRWYINGMKKQMTAVTNNEQVESLNLFFDLLNNIIFPGVRVNFASLCSRQFLKLSNLKNQILSSDWNIRELNIEHHQFVNLAKKDFESMEKLLSSISLTTEGMKDIWLGAWMRTTKVMLNGFGNIKSCNNDGRSLMIGDTRAIASIFTSISGIVVDTSDILEYINAYFYKQSDFLIWAETAINKYKHSHIISLAKTGLSAKLSTKDIRDTVSKIEAISSRLSKKR